MSGWRQMFGGLPSLTVFGGPSSGSAVQPSTGPGGVNAGQLQPNSRAQNMEAGVPYHLVPAYPPFVRIAADRNIIYMCRTRTLIFGGNGIAAGTTTQQWQFSVPTIIIARTATGVDESGAGLPVGRSGLDTFRAQLSRVGAASDLIDSGGGGAANPAVNVYGSCLYGTAAQPAFFPGTGLFADTGSFLNATVQILIANCAAHLCLWCLEEYGPARG